MFTSVHIVNGQSVPLCHQGYESTESGEVEFVRRSTRRRVHKDPIIDESGTSDTEESDELDDREEDDDDEDDDDDVIPGFFTPCGNNEQFHVSSCNNEAIQDRCQ